MFSTATPRWQRIAVVLIILGTFLTVVYIARLSQRGFAQQSTQVNTSERNDCRAVIQAARRDVFDKLNLILDVDRTTHDQLLGEALIDRVQGGTGDPAVLAAYQENNELLAQDKALAQALVPSLPEVDDIVRRGGRLPVLEFDRSITEQHFDACPKVG